MSEWESSALRSKKLRTLQTLHTQGAYIHLVLWSSVLCGERKRHYGIIMESSWNQRTYRCNDKYAIAFLKVFSLNLFDPSETMVIKQFSTSEYRNRARPKSKTSTSGLIRVFLRFCWVAIWSDPSHCRPCHRILTRLTRATCFRRGSYFVGDLLDVRACNGSPNWNEP